MARADWYRFSGSISIALKMIRSMRGATDRLTRVNAPRLSGALIDIGNIRSTARGGKCPASKDYIVAPSE